ncbi:MAG: transposase [Rhodobacteraceae bacterium]|nr:transposase [Paracoccaceae bacterium]
MGSILSFKYATKAQVAINVWLRQYNRIRPHRALGMRPTIPVSLSDRK